MQEYQLEINGGEAAELVKSGAKVFVLEENYNDLEFVQEVLHARKGSTEILDMNDVHPLVMHYGTESELKKIGERYEGAVIVCPHGNTSRKFAEGLESAGVRAYSLKGGIAGMRLRL